MFFSNDRELRHRQQRYITIFALGVTFFITCSYFNLTNPYLLGFNAMTFMIALSRFDLKEVYLIEDRLFFYERERKKITSSNQELYLKYQELKKENERLRLLSR